MVTTCPRCSTPREGSYRMCPSCGFDYWKDAAATTCPRCQVPRSGSMPICPSCGYDYRNADGPAVGVQAPQVAAWVPQRANRPSRLYKALLTLAFLAVLGAAGLYFNSQVQNAKQASDTAITNYANQGAQPPMDATPAPAGPVTYQIGDTITVTNDGADWAKITVSDVGVASSYTGTGDYPYTDKPQTAGDVFISANVTYLALTNGVDYNPFDWQVFCVGVAVENFTIVLSGPKPELHSGTLPNGRSASGYVVYEVPATGEVRMSYGANTFSNSGPVFEVIIRAA